MRNKNIVEKQTGEILAVCTTPFLTRYCDVAPTLVETDPEVCVDTTLYQPLNEVVERCERAGMLRELLGGAQRLVYDSKEELADDVLDELTPVSGDLFEDVNEVMAVYDASVAASKARTEVLDESGADQHEQDLEATSDEENAVSDDLTE